ncbi:chloride channel protein [Telluribacter humicola]|uniref:chloride channel protein n=1 Tax=Telluribacter humicola TaxID=1720261 RepID=UPI001A968667|nr:chloride channel protein [Telluribacter humicola]
MREKIWWVTGKVLDKLIWLRHKIINQEVRTITLQALPFWVASFVTGLVAVGYEKLFAWFERMGREMVLHTPWVIFITAPAFFTLSWWLVNRFAPTARGSGIPQLMASIELANPKQDDKVDQLLGLRIALVKVLSSLSLLVGNGAIGREGPTLQISASIFRFVNRLLPSYWPKVSKRIMLVTGGASGLAAAFNTPLGGIVFVVEELTKTHITYFRTAVFASVIIAGMTAQALLGPYLYLGYPQITPVGFSFIGVVLLAGILSGLAGALLAKVILYISDWKTLHIKGQKQQALFVATLGLLFACLIYFSGVQAGGSGKELMNRLLFTPEKNIQWYEFPARFIGPILSYHSGGAGGVFATSLSAGATLGAGIAELLQLARENYNLVMLVSMVGYLTGVTRSPFTSAILVLEMTDRHSAIFYLLLAGMVANLMGYYVDRKSFYEHLKEHFLKPTVSKA